jgi:tetratricopeptide (TPR) repeat protein
MHKRGAAHALACVLLAATVSCRSPREQARAAFDEAHGRLMQGDADGALRLLDRVYRDPKCESYRPPLLQAIVFVNLATGRVDAAEGRLRAAAAESPALAAAAVGQIEEHLLRQRRFDDLAAWCSSLQSNAFPEPVLVRIADYHARALTAGGRTAELLSALPAYFPRFSEPNVFSLVNARFSTAVNAGAHDEAAQWIETLAQNTRASPARQGTLAGLKTELLLARGETQAADAFFRAGARAIPDGHAARIFARVAGKETPESVEALCVFALKELPDQTATRQTAAQTWIGLAEKQAAPALIVQRLKTISETGFPNSFLLDQIDRAYSLLLEKGVASDHEALLKLCQGLAASEPVEGVQARFTEIALDMCFYLDRFGLAVSLLEKPIPGRDEEWRLMLLPKARAHLALQEGRPREAVGYFREFVAKIAQSQAERLDPIRKTRITKEMILGLNAKRIGDILKQAGAAEEAAGAYAEARGYYEQALAAFPKDAPEWARIQEELRGIPAR